MERGWPLMVDHGKQDIDIIYYVDTYIRLTVDG